MSKYIEMILSSEWETIYKINSKKKVGGEDYYNCTCMVSGKDDCIGTKDGYLSRGLTLIMIKEELLKSLIENKPMTRLCYCCDKEIKKGEEFIRDNQGDICMKCIEE